MKPSLLDVKFQKVYAKVLPYLGVSCKIQREWRSLPEMYQGLALLNFPLIALSEKLLFLLDNWGLRGRAQSDALAMAYENFLVEYGLYGSPLNWNYKDYGHLATKDTWFRNLWELMDEFDASLTMQDVDQLLGAREDDGPLTAEFHRVGYRDLDLEALNVVQRHRNLLHLSDISKSDGRTLDKFVVSDYAEISRDHVFLREEPTPTDYRLWEIAIGRLCSGTSNIPTALGPHLCHPHIPCRWFTTQEGAELYQTEGGLQETSHRAYVRIAGPQTRHGRRYTYESLREGGHQGTHFASVDMTSETVAVLHSIALMPISLPPVVDFGTVLAGFGNPSLWQNLHYDGDGSWIRTGLSAGSICIAHDGSYMSEQSQELCSAGVVFYCRTSW
jgi:hypothetical protein